MAFGESLLDELDLGGLVMSHTPMLPGRGFPDTGNFCPERRGTPASVLMLVAPLGAV